MAQHSISIQKTLQVRNVYVTLLVGQQMFDLCIQHSGLVIRWNDPLCCSSFAAFCTIFADLKRLPPAATHFTPLQQQRCHFLPGQSYS